MSFPTYETPLWAYFCLKEKVCLTTFSKSSKGSEMMGFLNGVSFTTPTSTSGGGKNARPEIKF